MGWFIRVKCDHYINGKRRRFNRLMPLDADFHSWVLKNIPEHFYGRAIHVITPLHHNVYMIGSKTHKLINCY